MAQTIKNLDELQTLVSSLSLSNAQTHKLANAAAVVIRRIVKHNFSQQKDIRSTDFKQAQKLDPTVISAKQVKKIEEEAKKAKKEAEKAQNFQKTLEELKDIYSPAKKWWLVASIAMVVLTAGIFIYYREDFGNIYPIYLFLSVITFIVIRQYTNAKQLNIEAENRLAMAKMFEKVIQEKKDSDYQQFLPKIVDAIAYSTRNTQDDKASFAEIVKSIIDKK